MPHGKADPRTAPPLLLTDPYVPTKVTYQTPCSRQSLHIATSETACPGGSGKESGIRIGSDNNERSRTLAAQLLPASQATYRPLPGTRGLQERLPQSIVCRSLLSARAEAEELKPAPPPAAPQAPPMIRIPPLRPMVLNSSHGAESHQPHTIGVLSGTGRVLDMDPA